MTKIFSNLTRHIIQIQKAEYIFDQDKHKKIHTNTSDFWNYSSFSRKKIKPWQQRGMASYVKEKHSLNDYRIIMRSRGSQKETTPRFSSVE